MSSIRSFLLGFVVLFFLPIYCIGETANAVDTDRTYSNQDEMRTTALKKLLNSARNYKKEGQFEEALNAYIQFYSESKNIHRLSGVRTSSVLQEIRELGGEYKPALMELKRIRNLIKQKLLSGHYISKDCRELLSIDKALEQKNATIILFDNIVNTFGNNTSQSNNFAIAIWEELYNQKRYKDIEGIISKLTRREVTLITNYMVEVDFPSKLFRDSEVYRQWMESKIVDDGRRIHQILMALDRLEESTKLEKWILYFAGDKKKYDIIMMQP